MHNLHTKLSLALLAVRAVASVGLAVVLTRASQMYQQEVQQQLNDELADHIVEQYELIRADSVAEDALADLFSLLMVINPSIEVYLLDPEGRIIADAAPEGRIRRERDSLVPVQQLLQGSTRFPIFGDDPRDPRGSKVFSTARILSEGRLQGYLYVVQGGEAYDSAAAMLASSYIVRLSAWLGAAILLLTFLAAGFLFRRLTRPLSALDAEIAQFELTELSPLHPAHAAGGDEVQCLQASFTRLAQRLRQQLDELERTDRLRRELVASVSHDLRTPLTHLQGYLETLQLKDDSLQPAERAEYLRIAVDHCDRLARLIDDLFELAKLEALRVPIETERFSVVELARDVVDKLQLTARQRGIQLSVADAPRRCHVEANPGLIERTLENLIANALQHTDSGGVIDVVPRRRSQAVQVEVRDTGRGISEADQQRVFERFFRTSGDRKSDSGTGLGLAIAKRAVELHRGSISVHSVPGQGSVFGFELPHADVSAADAGVAPT